MKHNTAMGPGKPATLQDVIDRVDGNAVLSDSRRRDLRSGIVTYAKIVGEAPAAIPMDLASIRKTLDGVVPLQAKVSRKRWANLRSDIAGAIAASGLRPMLKTFGVELDKVWAGLLDAANDKAIANGLSRLARWASLRHVSPEKIDCAVLGQFFAERVRKPRSQYSLPAAQRGQTLEQAGGFGAETRFAGCSGSEQEHSLRSNSLAATSRIIHKGGRRVFALVQRSRSARRRCTHTCPCSGDVTFAPRLPPSGSECRVFRGFRPEPANLSEPTGRAGSLSRHPATAMERTRAKGNLLCRRSRLRFDQGRCRMGQGASRTALHLHWPQGKGKPALMVIREDETKNEEPLEFELPSVLSDRLYTFRNEIAAAVIGRRPEFLFVSKNGKRRTLGALRVAIQRTVIRRLGVKITPHQFRHLGAKIALDANPGAYELVRQLLGHKALKTTTRFYAGPDTRRAGRAHADLIRKLRDPKPDRSRRRRGEGRE